MHLRLHVTLIEPTDCSNVPLVCSYSLPNSTAERRRGSFWCCPPWFRRTTFIGWPLGYLEWNHYLSTRNAQTYITYIDNLDTVIGYTTTILYHLKSSFSYLYLCHSRFLWGDYSTGFLAFPPFFHLTDFGDLRIYKRLIHFVGFGSAIIGMCHLGLSCLLFLDFFCGGKPKEVGRVPPKRWKRKVK